MKIRLQVFLEQISKNLGNNYVDVELKIRLFYGLHPYRYENRGGGPGGAGGDLGDEYQP